MKVSEFKSDVLNYFYENRNLYENSQSIYGFHATFTFVWYILESTIITLGSSVTEFRWHEYEKWTKKLTTID